MQVDGNISDVSSIASSNDTQYDTDDEAFAPGQPVILDIKSDKESSPNLPLCLLLNA